MAYVATPEDIQKIRYELNDNSGPGLYILDDSTITYYLEKNFGSIARTSIDCCRAILLRLSMDSKDQVVDVLALRNSKAAEQYRLALELYLKDPSLNPLYNNLNGWAGNISVSEIEENNNTLDNNIPSLAIPVLNNNCTRDIDNPFSIC